MKTLAYFIGFLGLFLLSSCSRPLAKFTYQQSDVQAPAKVVFENNSKNAKTYDWDFGDGNTSTEEAPLHEYTQPGYYEVVLTVTKGKKEDFHKDIVNIQEPEKMMVRIETDFGNMVVELYDETPQHRDNFIKLAREGFYDGLLFHRVMNKFMIQGGDPKSLNAPSGQQLGMGGPGYTIPAEFNESLYHVKGALAAARQPDQVNPKKASSGSQFYIVQGKKYSDGELDMLETRSLRKYTEAARQAYKEVGGTPFLDGEYTVFGRVVEGLDVIDEIAAQMVNQANRPNQDIKMKVTIIE